MTEHNLRELLRSANKTLDKAKNNKPEGPSETQQILDSLLKLNQQLVKALEREIKVDNKIEVQPAKVQAPKIEVKPEVQVKAPDVKVNPVITQDKRPVEYTLQYKGSRLNKIIATPTE